MSWAGCLGTEPVPGAVSQLPANLDSARAPSYRGASSSPIPTPQSSFPGKTLPVVMSKPAQAQAATAPALSGGVCGADVPRELVSLGRWLPKASGQPFVPWCLGLWKEQGCGKGRGSERESWQGHGAQLREGHGMWLAAGCAHGSAGVERQALTTTPRDCPPRLGDAVTRSSEPRHCGWPTAWVLWFLPQPGAGSGGAVQSRTPLGAALALEHVAPSWVWGMGSPPLGGTPGRFSCPHACGKSGPGHVGCLFPPHSSV